MMLIMMQNKIIAYYLLAIVGLITVLRQVDKKLVYGLHIPKGFFINMKNSFFIFLILGFP